MPVWLLGSCYTIRSTWGGSRWRDCDAGGLLRMVCRDLRTGQGFLRCTIELKIKDLKPARGTRLFAEAKVVSHTHRTAFATIEIFAGDILVPFATATYSIIDETKTNPKG